MCWSTLWTFDISRPSVSSGETAESVTGGLYVSVKEAANSIPVIFTVRIE